MRAVLVFAASESRAGDARFSSGFAACLACKIDLRRMRGAQRTARSAAPCSHAVLAGAHAVAAGPPGGCRWVPLVLSPWTSQDCINAWVTSKMKSVTPDLFCRRDEIDIVFVILQWSGAC